MNILITGATSGIGNDLAKKLAHLNHQVYACCHTVEELKRLSRKKRSNIHYLKLDITNENDYSILSSLDIDVLINQAGLGIGGSLLDLDTSKIQENFEVNVFSTLRLSKFYIEDCSKKQKKGKILITSSLAGYLPIPFMGSYVATKASLTILTKVLHQELKKSNLNISIKLILPGAYYTGFNQSMFNYIEESKYFKNSEKTYYKLQKIFSIIEKKTNSSIVRKMTRATLSPSSKFLYSAPLIQSIFTRIYRIFSK